MSSHYVDLSSAAQTAFANINTATFNSEVQRSVANLPGNFSSRVIKGRTYWSYQAQATDGIPMQIYIGPDSENIRQLIELKKQTPSGHLTSLSRSCQALGCPVATTSHGRVIKKLADFGFFKAGGILAGTHAFLAFQNYLGVTWSSGNTTMDVDFTHAGKSISIALPSTLKVDTHKAIESLGMGFFPACEHAKYIKQDESDFVLDFLTVVGKSGLEPIFSKQLNVFLQPLKFMEISVEDPVQTAFLTKSGSVLINIPQPERFAIHKLIVQGERKNQPLKSAKDVIQAAALISWLLDNNPDVLNERINEIMATGPDWKMRLDNGFAALNKKFPELYSQLNDVAYPVPRRG